jgi:hypothetical protein
MTISRIVFSPATSANNLNASVMKRIEKSVQEIARHNGGFLMGKFYTPHTLPHIDDSVN